MTTQAVLAIDEGTTNSKAVLVDTSGSIIASGSAPVPIAHPKSGWVQQDADEIWQATLAAIAACLEHSPDTDIVALGISNQRESILIWDRTTGEALGPVITWQCRRTSAECAELRDAGHEEDVIRRTGLPLDPLFPATKIAWLLDQCASDRDICVGTVDSWLIWKLTGHKVHATDRSNAARTQLFNLAETRWDPSLCTLFGVDPAMLPEVKDSAFVFGTTRNVGALPDGIPISAAIGDSHAALFSHGAITPGDSKVTFGTGSSVMSTLSEFVVPPAGITTTIAWSIGGEATFAFEGNILTSASILPWTAKVLGLESVSELLDLSRTAQSNEGVSLVPAHVGLGSPHWDSEARGLICGLSFGTGPEHIALAAVESIAFQVHDVFEVIVSASNGLGRLSVDGGPSGNPFLMQMVADYLDHTVVPCRNTEASALGAAFLAGIAVGFWKDAKTVSALANRAEPLSPKLDDATRRAAILQWSNAVARTLRGV